MPRPHERSQARCVLCATLSVAVLSVLLLAACTTAQAGLDLSAGSVDAAGRHRVGSAGPGGSAQPSGSANPNVVQISAQGIKFEQTTVTAPADTPFQIVFENKDPGTPHNVALQGRRQRGRDVQGRRCSTASRRATYDVPALDAGTYAFVCTVHPTMIGTLTAQ